MALAIDRLDHVVLNVKDVAVSAEWYTRVLGMEREEFASRSGPRIAVRFGRQKLNLRPVDADRVAWFTGESPTSGSDDLCFVTPQPIGDVVAHLRARGVAIEVGPVTRQGALGEMLSVYCRDPDGNLIEVASYLPAT